MNIKNNLPYTSNGQKTLIYPKITEKTQVLYTSILYLHLRSYPPGSTYQTSLLPSGSSPETNPLPQTYCYVFHLVIKYNCGPSLGYAPISDTF